jgi:hypothetical protein
METFKIEISKEKIFELFFGFSFNGRRGTQRSADKFIKLLGLKITPSELLADFKKNS